MAVTTRQPKQVQLISSRRSSRRRENADRSPPVSTAYAGLKAGVVGGVGLLSLILLGLIPPSENIPVVTLALLVVPGFLVVCFSTGLLACILADASVKSSQKGGEIGWIAGYWTGIIGGIFAMGLAALGFLMQELGANLVTQWSPEALARFHALGFSTGDLALVGRVVAALVVYGIIGSLTTALLSSISGMIYPYILIGRIRK